MTGWLAAALGALAALALASGLSGLRARSPRTGDAAPGDPAELLARRELAGLREQLAEGELSEYVYRELRERLALRIAAAPTARTPARPARRQSGLWLAGLAAALAAAVLLVLPALRPRAPGASLSGDNFTAPAQTPASPQQAPAMTAARLAALLRRAFTLDRDGKLAQAIPLYRTGLAFLPARADLRAQLGFALARTEQTGQALAQLRQAVAQQPRLAAARLYLGAVLWKQGRQRQARAQWRRYLALDPHGAGAAFVRRELGQR